MIKNVIFDFGGVLFDWNPRNLYRKIFSSEQEMEDFLSNICTRDWNLNHDRGVSFAENAKTLVKTHPEKKDLIEAYWKRWNEMISGEIVGTVDIINELYGNNIGLYGLTNMPTEGYNYLVQNYKFLSLFKDIVASGIERVIKPNKEIYNILLNRNNLNAENCVFVDDVKENIIACEALGIKGIVFENPKQLKKELLKLGVI